jgi:hypothetical protein
MPSALLLEYAQLKLNNRKFTGIKVLKSASDGRIQVLKRLKSSVFWDVSLCSPLKIKQSKASYLFHAGFLLGLFFDPEDIIPKLRLTFNGLHVSISKKIELFIATDVRTSNPTFKTSVDIIN